MSDPPCDYFFIMGFFLPIIFSCRFFSAAVIILAGIFFSMRSLGVLAFEGGLT